MDILRLPALKAMSVDETDGAYAVTAEALPLEYCPHDGCDIVGFGRRTQSYLDVPRDGKPVVIRLTRRRWRCNVCRRVSMDPIPDMDERRRATKRLITYLVEQAQSRTNVSLAAEIGSTEKTVRNIRRSLVQVYQP